jgi:hypothetical protein
VWGAGRDLGDPVHVAAHPDLTVEPRELEVACDTGQGPPRHDAQQAADRQDEGQDDDEQDPEEPADDAHA